MDDLTVKIAAVKKQACFSPLTEEEIIQLADLLRTRHIEPGQVIVKEGDPVDSFYLIAVGVAEVRREVIKEGVPETEFVATLSAGGSIGLNETGFYSISGKRTATVIAQTEMILFHLSVTEFRGFALANSHINHVMREYSQRFILK
jgi:CRP-like cAMP-binding protein